MATNKELLAKLGFDVSNPENFVKDALKKGEEFERKAQERKLAAKKSQDSDKGRVLGKTYTR